VVGTLSVLLGTYSFVANYKGFKESIVEGCEDARDFAVEVCDPFVKKAGVPPEEVYRFERRLKTPGKLYRLTKRLNKLAKSVDNLSPKDVRKELAGLRAELESIGKHLSQSEREALDPMLKRPKLPPPQQWPDPEGAKAAVRNDDEEEQPAFFEGEPGFPNGLFSGKLLKSREKGAADAGNGTWLPVRIYSPDQPYTATNLTIA
jgi:hypothetical protein